MAAGVAALSAAALAALSLTAPPPASGQEPDLEDIGLWDIDSEIEFEPREPVPGRRLYFEELRVTGDRAHVTLRAAADLEIRVRAFGGLWGRELRYWSAAALTERETISYSLPLVGGEPSLTFSWEDGTGQGGAVTIGAERIPYPLPSVEGGLCDMEITSLGWTPGLVAGVISSECVTRVDEVVKVWTAVGHDLIGVDAVIESTVTEVTGAFTVTDGGFQVTVPFAVGETEFSLPVAIGEVTRMVEIELALEAAAPGPDAGPRQAHTPPGAYRDADPDREPAAPGYRQDRVQDGHRQPREWHHLTARDLGIPVHPGRDRNEERDAHDRARGACAGRGGAAAGDRARSHGGPGVLGEHRGGRPLPGHGLPGGGPGDAADRAEAGHRGPDAGAVRMALRRLAATAALIAAALASMAAEPPGDAEMIAQFDRVLTAMAYAASGIALFSIVWAGFVLMAEGSDQRSAGRAKSAVAGAVIGLVLVLSAKGVTFALTRAVGPVP